MSAVGSLHCVVTKVLASTFHFRKKEKEGKKEKEREKRQKKIKKDKLHTYKYNYPCLSVLSPSPIHVPANLDFNVPFTLAVFNLTV